MAPNAMTYGALPGTDAGAKAQQPEVSNKLAAVVAVCAVMLFFAARTAPKEFSHDEVLDLAAFCDAGKFIGGCNDCKECASYEFANGGCSYFKDTFCTWCNPIADCPREKIQCDGIHDHVCTECDCDDPVKEWGDLEVRGYMAHHPKGQGKLKREVVHQTFGCYIASEQDEGESGSCLPCTVCPVGKYQQEACDQSTNADTVCVSCTECDDHEWTVTACTYTSDSECAKCDYCSDADGLTIGTYTDTPCVQGNPIKVGNNAVCKKCTTCDDGSFVSAFCVGGEPVMGPKGMGSDTECKECAECLGSKEETMDTDQWKEHVAGDAGVCKKGERFPGDGCDDSDKEDGECVNHDTICQDCIYPEDAGCDKDEENCKFFFETPCVSTSPYVPKLKKCRTCGGPTFEIRACTAFEASVCKACAENSDVDPESGKLTSGLIEHCNFENHRCASDGSFTEAVMGLHHALTDKASAFKGGVADIKNFDMTKELNMEHVVLSWCAAEDNTGACNGAKKLYWEDGDKDGKTKPDKDTDMSEECNLDACDNGFFGTQCQYAKVYQGCGTDEFMIRHAKKGRYWYNDKSPGNNPTPDLHYAHSEETSKNQFVTWCYQLCEEHPFCHAFEIADGGTGPSESGEWDLEATTSCKFYSEPQFCNGSNHNDQPDWSKDCFVHHLRDTEALQREASCPGAGPSNGQPALFPSSFPEDLEEQKDDDEKHHDCDSYKGETWCELLKQCVNQAHTPCVLPGKKKLRDQCDGEQVFCYCTGMCMDAGDPACHDKKYKESPKDAKLTKGGMIEESCWAVNNGVEEVPIGPLLTR